jgi:hypothetical protein
MADLLRNDDAVPAAAVLGENFDIPALLNIILTKAGAPLEVDDVVSVVAELLGVTDQQSRTSLAQGVNNEAPTTRDVAFVIPTSAAEQRLYIERMWVEVAQLPRPQRVALLLALRDDRGESLLALLSDERVITVRRIAAILEMGLNEIGDIWGELPLDDAKIGAMLDVRPRQVASLRLAARRRLARRLKS